jgi:hypothetical protein
VVRRDVDMAPAKRESVSMWRAIICLTAALIVGVPNLAAAQYSDTDRQNPAAYTDEDSQPLRILAYLVAPIGFILEWGVARPIHYVATETFLAPIFNGDTHEPEYRPPAIAEIPLDDVGDEPPRTSRFSSDVRSTSPEETRMPSTGAGAPTGAGAESQPIIH